MSLIKKLLDPQELARMVKFGVTGVANTLVDYLVFLLLAQWLGLNATLSQVCSYAAGMLNSFLINRSWTFRSKAHFFSPQLVKFIIANLVVLLISIGLLNLFYQRWGFALWFAKLLMTGITMVLNFIFSRLWVFREKG